MADKKKTFEVTEDRFIGDQFRKAGETVDMSERASRYYREPHGTGLKVPSKGKEKVGGLDDPNVKNPQEHATGKSGQ